MAGLRLSPLVPNPTPGQATIRFTLPLAMSATMRIYDLGGRLVRFVGTGVLPAGAHVVHWDGRDSEARALPNGLYLVVLEAQGRRLARRLVVVR